MLLDAVIHTTSAPTKGLEMHKRQVKNLTQVQAMPMKIYLSCMHCVETYWDEDEKSPISPLIVVEERKTTSMADLRMEINHHLKSATVTASLITT